FPALRPLSLRRDLQQILWRPKILDLVAIVSLRGEQPAVREWVGESSVITWFWQSEVEDAPEPLTRAGTLMELAEMQANELAFKVPAARFGDRGALDQLVEARLLQAEGTRIGFS